MGDKLGLKNFAINLNTFENKAKNSGRNTYLYYNRSRRPTDYPAQNVKRNSGGRKRLYIIEPLDDGYCTNHYYEIKDMVFNTPYDRHVDGDTGFYFVIDPNPKITFLPVPSSVPVVRSVDY